MGSYCKWNIRHQDTALSVESVERLDEEANKIIVHMCWIGERPWHVSYPEKVPLMSRTEIWETDFLMRQPQCQLIMMEHSGTMRKPGFPQSRLCCVGMILASLPHLSARIFLPSQLSK